MDKDPDLLSDEMNVEFLKAFNKSIYDCMVDKIKGFMKISCFGS